MRKYIFDKLFVLLTVVGLMISVPFVWGSVGTVIMEAVLALGYGYMCWRVLILPLDLLHGSQSLEVKTVYSAELVYIERYHIFSKKYCFEWKFYYGSNQTITLLVPASVTKEELDSIDCPRQDAPIRITYYHFSKILIHWEPV